MRVKKLSSDFIVEADTIEEAIEKLMENEAVQSLYSFKNEDELSKQDPIITKEGAKK